MGLHCTVVCCIHQRLILTNKRLLSVTPRKRLVRAELIYWEKRISLITNPQVSLSYCLLILTDTNIAIDHPFKSFTPTAPVPQIIADVRRTLGTHRLLQRITGLFHRFSF